jgi:hypothetical protein
MDWEALHYWNGPQELDILEGTQEANRKNSQVAQETARLQLQNHPHRRKKQWTGRRSVKNASEGRRWDAKTVIFWSYPYFFSYRPVCLHTFLWDSQYLGLPYYCLYIPWYCSSSPFWYSPLSCSWASWPWLPIMFLAIFLSLLHWVLPLPNWRRSHRALAYSLAPSDSCPYLRTLYLLLQMHLPYSLPLWW